MKKSKEIVSQNITCWPELGVNYWGINKNATSTIITHFTKLVYNDQSMLGDVELGQSAKKYLSQRYIDKSEALRNGYVNFTIVRNPYDRFESCFKQFKYPKYEVHSLSASKARFNPDWSADDFLNFIEKKFVEKRSIGNKHYRKQSWFVPNPNFLQHVIKLEKLNNHWPFDFPAPEFKSNFQPSMEINYNKEKFYKLFKEDFDNFKYTK